MVSIVVPDFLWGITPGRRPGFVLAEAGGFDVGAPGLTQVPTPIRVSVQASDSTRCSVRPEKESL